MVYKENPIKMDDLGVPPFSETSILLIKEILHQLVGKSSLSYYLQGLYTAANAGFLTSTVPPIGSGKNNIQTNTVLGTNNQSFADL